MGDGGADGGDDGPGDEGDNCMKFDDEDANLLAVGIIGDNLHLKLHHPLLWRRPKLILSVH